MVKFAIILSEELNNRLRKFLSFKHGYRQGALSDFIRQAIEKELTREENQINEQNIPR
jgi:hypothetical protein